MYKIYLQIQILYTHYNHINTSFGNYERCAALNVTLTLSRLMFIWCLKVFILWNYLKNQHSNYQMSIASSIITCWPWDGWWEFCAFDAHTSNVTGFDLYTDLERLTWVRKTFTRYHIQIQTKYIQIIIQWTNLDYKYIFLCFTQYPYSTYNRELTNYWYNLSRYIEINQTFQITITLKVN